MLWGCSGSPTDNGNYDDADLNVFLPLDAGTIITDTIKKDTPVADAPPPPPDADVLVQPDVCVEACVDGQDYYIPPTDATDSSEIADADTLQDMLCGKCYQDIGDAYQDCMCTDTSLDLDTLPPLPDVPVLPDTPTQPDTPVQPDTVSYPDTEQYDSIFYPDTEQPDTSVGPDTPAGPDTVSEDTGPDTLQCIPLAINDVTCNGIDDDCDGVTDENYVSTQTGESCGKGICKSAEMFVCINGSKVENCEPGKPNPIEVCNGLDDNCDGIVDNNQPPETCDGVDNNCNALVDENASVTNPSGKFVSIKALQLTLDAFKNELLAGGVGKEIPISLQALVAGSGNPADALNLCYDSMWAMSEETACKNNEPAPIACTNKFKFEGSPIPSLKIWNTFGTNNSNSLADITVSKNFADTQYGLQVWVNPPEETAACNHLYSTFACTFGGNYSLAHVLFIARKLSLKQPPQFDQLMK